MTDLARTMALLARWTAHRITAGAVAGVPQQEETLTESILLDLALNVGGHDVRMLTRGEESLIGADWVWWIEDSRGGLWLGLLIQAKKFVPHPKRAGGNYKMGQMTAGQPRQVETLVKVSRWIGVTALYALYNPLSDEDFSSGCYFAGPVAPHPLDGVTFLHSSEALRQVRMRSAGSDIVSLEDVRDRAIPWSCLFSCTLRPYPRAEAVPLRINHFPNRPPRVDVTTAQRTLRRLIDLAGSSGGASGAARATLRRSVRLVPPEYVDGGDALAVAFERGQVVEDQLGNLDDDGFVPPDVGPDSDVLPSNVRGVVVVRAARNSDG